MSWVQQVHNAAVVARSLGCLCHGASDTVTVTEIMIPNFKFTGTGNQCGPAPPSLVSSSLRPGR